MDELQLIAEYQSRCSTKDGGAAELLRATTAFVAALAQADDERLASMETVPWGDTMPVAMVAHIATSHIWYHDGQLNFIQSLLGDGDYHW